MKILFLDCDGVLNCQTSFGKPGVDPMWPFDPYMVILVDRIIQATGCLVVVSSSWRNADEGMTRINKALPNVIAKTPCIPLIGGAEMCERGKEIAAWLKDHTVERYAILDDDSDMLPEQLPNFFKTSWQTGITEEIAQNVIKHLSDN